jgi:hypothetical protein
MSFVLSAGGAATEEEASVERAQFLPVLPDYFRTLDVPLIQGREFSVKDSAGTMQVAVINEVMAKGNREDEIPARDAPRAATQIALRHD